MLGAPAHCEGGFRNHGRKEADGRAQRGNHPLLPVRPIRLLTSAATPEGRRTFPLVRAYLRPHLRAASSGMRMP